MSESFIGEIRMFGGNFAPRSNAFCDGQLLSIAQNPALFSLLGTTYGGDGRVTFQLPDLRGRVPVHQGSGPGLTFRNMGSKGGFERVTLAPNEVAIHSHDIKMAASVGTDNEPAGNVLGASPNVRMYRTRVPDTDLAPASISNVGDGQTHDNLMPFQCISFIIALQGIFPSRN